MYLVYRYMIDDQWIYVGKTEHNLVRRIYSHTFDTKFKKYRNARIEFCILDSKSDMDIMELMLIKLMHPVLNANDATVDNLPFAFDESKIKWFDYCDAKLNHDPIITGKDIKDFVLSQMTFKRIENLVRTFEMNTEFCIYSGPSYGTYKVPIDQVLSLLNLPPQTKINKVINRLNYIFGNNTDKLSGRYRCFNGFDNSLMFYYYVN